MNERGPIAGAQAIQIEGLTKSFGSRSVLRGIDLDVKTGESVVIFGPNGAGKTTLIKILATIMHPSSGTIMVEGANLKEAGEDIRRKIGVVSHQTFLYGSLTAGENLDFYCRMYDVGSRKERIRELAGMVGMSSRLNDRVATLSRGMQQRFSIARALLHRPAIMLLDEPETGLDQEGIPLLWNTWLNEGVAKRTLVLITHSLERGFELADRVLILNRGKIVYSASRDSLHLAGLKEAYLEHCTKVAV